MTIKIHGELRVIKGVVLRFSMITFVQGKERVKGRG